MYCKQCGAEMKDGQKFCTACGSKLEESAVTENTIEIELDKIKEAQKALEEAEDITADELLDEDTSSISNNEAIEFYTKYKSNGISKYFTPKNIAIAVCTVALLLIVIISCVSHFNSAPMEITDEEKIEKIINTLGPSSDAIAQLESINTPEAKTLIKYIEINMAKGDFLDVYDGERLITSAEDDMYIKYKNFVNLVYEFYEEYDPNLLHESCRSGYYDFKKSVDIVENLEIGYDDFYDLQLVFLNDVIKNNRSYTLRELQDNIDASERAENNFVLGINKTPEIIDEFDYFDTENFNTYITALPAFSKAIKSLRFTADQECFFQATYIGIDLYKYKMTDKLHLDNPDKSYKYHIDDSLEDITLDSGICENANTLEYTLKIELLAYYLHHYI